MSEGNALTCPCGNGLDDGDSPDSGLCDWCEYEAGQKPHEGHYSRLGGTWYCDTCDSPYCELA